MKIVQINATCGRGSTGKICVSVSKLLTENSIENYILYSQGKSDYPLGINYAVPAEVKASALSSRVLGNWGFEGKQSTKRLIEKLEEIRPDAVHLHNLHSHACNLEQLFLYLKKSKIKVFWTFHDCWEFTAYCMYYDMAGCDKWKTECVNCPQKASYSWIFDNSSKIFKKKRALFSGLDMTIITPSKWLADEVKQSFLKDYPIKVINNGIDLSVFTPTESDFRIKYNCEDKLIVLGVAFVWDARKGIDIFIELSKRLPDEYRIVLVGTDDSTDEFLPENIISIHRTQNQRELAGIYSAADVFVNPTREENYPTVNMESIACGTPVVTFRTGGSAEIVDSGTGAVVDKDDVDGLEKEIIRICQNKERMGEHCLSRAESFDANNRLGEYLKLYYSMQ